MIKIADGAMLLSTVPPNPPHHYALPLLSDPRTVQARHMHGIKTPSQTPAVTPVHIDRRNEDKIRGMAES